ncbi:TetR/AcrR family transcriptional regulator [Pseudoduganella umbonata]|uniref:TetR family transcriptional regulator n=1 Tax=Pseudoduganella umbonata TaxID=864828 RepID=A0A4P8HYP4_9BURK|nr:TetR family transcriptional regulator [Pseudoduganella umbonata]MBB3223432.1 TetR/AcrR family transcriptional repressor of nem operon [Pseudoduganella umbonata]QCP13674.1 TetR family transcriptional regulator [Pseudoduganella umbonata]
MRKSRAEAAATRERIVDAASATFRRQGIAATGLADLMAGAGLTHGGFYKHFASKEQVVAEAGARAIEQTSEAIGAAIAAAPGDVPLRRAIGTYLTTQHRDHPETGCAFAALGPELAREGDTVRAAAAAGMERLLGVFSQQASRADAVVALSAMVGAMTLARLAPNEAESARILDQVRAHLLAHLPSGDDGA